MKFLFFAVSILFFFISNSFAQPYPVLLTPEHNNSIDKITEDQELDHYSSKKGLIDHVVVNKMHHQMLLMNNDQVIKSYWIALSDKPEGAKQFRGDKRTPEGTYTLDYIKENSSFYRAMHISYPNASDIANAREHGRNPGGNIMIHGQPSGVESDSIQRTNWTNGCIALLNRDLDEFLSLVDVGTPITINP